MNCENARKYLMMTNCTVDSCIFITDVTEHQCWSSHNDFNSILKTFWMRKKHKWNPWVLFRIFFFSFFFEKDLQKKKKNARLIFQSEWSFFIKAFSLKYIFFTSMSAVFRHINLHKLYKYAFHFISIRINYHRVSCVNNN